MKRLTLIMLCFATAILVKAQKVDSTKKEYHIKYEVLTKKGKRVMVNYFDKDGKNAGNHVDESWIYKFTTTDKNQNIQLSTVGGQDGTLRNPYGKVWVKVNIYVNDKLIKSQEEKFQGLGPTISVNLEEIK